MTARFKKSFVPTVLKHYQLYLLSSVIITYSASEMTYIVSSGALNSTHSLTNHHILNYLQMTQQRL